MFFKFTLLGVLSFWWRFSHKLHQACIRDCFLIWWAVMTIMRWEDVDMFHLDCVVISPPEVWGEQLVILVHPVEVVGQLLRGVEVHHVDVGVGWSHLGHVGSVQHHGDHVVRQQVEEFLCDVVLGEMAGIERNLTLTHCSPQWLWANLRDRRYSPARDKTCSSCPPSDNTPPLSPARTSAPRRPRRRQPWCVSGGPGRDLLCHSWSYSLTQIALPGLRQPEENILK